MTAGRGGIGVWSVDSGAQLARFDVAARGAVLDPAGRRVVYVLKGDPRYHLADVAGGEGRAVLERPAGDQATEPAALYQTFGELPVSFSPDGRLIAAIQLVGGAHVWDASTGRHLRALSASPFRGGEIRFVDGGGLLVTNGAELAMWDPASWTRRWAITLGEAAVGPIEPVPGARAVAAGNEHGDAWIVGLDGAIERSFEAIHRSSINEVSFAEVDGDLLMILASDDHTISITDLTSGALRHRLEGHTEMVAALDVDTSGQLIASGSIDASVRLWDVRTGKQIAELLGAPDLGPLSAWFTRDGRAVLTSLGDAAALWSVAPARPGAREIADLDLRWAIERGSLVRR
jgi:WD40 repeat protein